MDSDSLLEFFCKHPALLAYCVGFSIVGVLFTIGCWTVILFRI